MSTNRRRKLNGVLTGVFALIIAIAAVINIVHVFVAAREAGVGFVDYAMLSDFGLFAMMWNNNPALVIISLLMFIGGFIGLVSRIR